MSVEIKHNHSSVCLQAEVAPIVEFYVDLSQSERMYFVDIFVPEGMTDYDLDAAIVNRKAEIGHALKQIVKLMETK